MAQLQPRYTKHGQIGHLLCYIFKPCYIEIESFMRGVVAEGCSLAQAMVQECSDDGAVGKVNSC